MSGDKHEARHEDLQQQLEEQQTAVDGAKELLEEGGDDPELQTVRPAVPAHKKHSSLMRLILCLAPSPNLDMKLV